MARKQYFCVIDTETTQTDKVADLGIVVCDRKGNIDYSVGLLVSDYYRDRENHPLFHMGDFLGGKANLPRRYEAYDKMLADGSRLLASIPAVNRLLAKIQAKYSPTYTAYNMAFDYGKMSNSNIDVSLMDDRFCLWNAAADKWAQTKAYRQFILDNHLFKSRTRHGNMSYPTNAEVMAAFITGANGVPDEPHTALEDARDFEVPILTKLVANTSRDKYMNPKGYNWRDYQVNNWFIPK